MKKLLMFLTATQMFMSCGGGNKDKSPDVIKYNAPQGTKTQPCLVEMPDRDAKLMAMQEKYSCLGATPPSKTYVDFCTETLTYFAQMSCGNSLDIQSRTVAFSAAHKQDSVVIAKASKLYNGQ
jgi:hypothetical protein